MKSMMKKLTSGAMALMLASWSAWAADAGVEMGAEDDMTVLGTEGSLPDADFEAKGYSVFGTPSVEVPSQFTNGAGSVVVASNLFVAGEFKAAGGIDLSGANMTVSNLTVQGILSAEGPLFQVLQNASMSSNLNVGGSASVGGNQTVTGSSTVGSLGVTGNGTVGGTLGVTGAATFNDAVTVEGPLTADSLVVDNDADVSGNLGVDGNQAVGGNQTVTGSSTVGSLGVTGNGTVGGNLGVTGNATISGVATAGTLAVVNDSTIGGTLGVTGPATFANNISVTGAAAAGSLSVVNDGSIGGNLDVTGDTTVGGALEVTGPATVTDTTESTSKDTGSLILEGGLGVEKSINAGLNLGVGGNGAVNGTLGVGTASPDANTKMQVQGGGASGNFATKIYVGSDLAAWVKKK